MPPTRLQLVTMLSAVSEAEFATLRTVLEVSDPVLSKPVSALVDAGWFYRRFDPRTHRRSC
jgi:DNA-binding MarR family transcriptional regulator